MKPEPPRVRIEELRLAGFRAFENARLTLDDLTVLVGRNGAGKSTIVDAFEFLREALTDSLENALERRGGIQAVMHKGPRPKKALSIALKLRLSRRYLGEVNQRLKLGIDVLGYNAGIEVWYGFRLAVRRGGKGFFVDREQAIAKSGRERVFGLVARDARAMMREALILPTHARFDVAFIASMEALRTCFLTYKLSPIAIRTEPTIGRAGLLNRDGSNVGDILKRLEKNKDDVAWIVKHLGVITPGIVGIKAGTAAGRRIVQFLQSTSGTKKNRFEIGDMSDGTLRSLAILLALRQQPTPALVCLDEIEDSVHPSALAVLLDAIAASTERCQVLLTSHSPEALGHEAVTAGRVRVVDWNAGRSGIFRLSKGAAQAARPPRSVGTLLRSNALFTEEAPEQIEGDFFGAG